MPPKKKSQKTTPKEPDEPLEYINHIREQSVQRYSSRRKNINHDIEQNTREIRALLKINAEIFDRVKSSSTLNGNSATVTRYGFDVVKVRNINGASQTQFITEEKRSQKDFSVTCLSELPVEMSGVIKVRYQVPPFHTLIDYDAFFNSSLLLHDDIIEPFLIKLKSHIESIHVCLGEIESWLQVSKSNIDFIEATFGKKLDIPTTADKGQVCACSTGTHADSDFCLRCGERYYGSPSS